jgi:hypothetical protein
LLDTIPHPPLFGARDVARIVGLSVHTVRDYAEKGLIGSFKIGHELRFSLPQINAFLAARERPVR